MRRCGFKTFHSFLPIYAWEERNVPLSGAPGSGAPRLDQVGEFEVATPGGVWVAAGVEEGHLMSDHVHMMFAIPPKYAVSQVTVIREYIRNQEQEDKRLEQMNLWR